MSSPNDIFSTLLFVILTQVSTLLLVDSGKVKYLSLSQCPEFVNFLNPPYKENSASHTAEHALWTFFKDASFIPEFYDGALYDQPSELLLVLHHQQNQRKAAWFNTYIKTSKNLDSRRLGFHDF